MYENLDDILNRLWEAHADSVTLEWVADGVEVMMYHGSTGLGSVVPQPVAGSIMREVAARAGRGGRTKGRFKASIGDRQLEFGTKEYDCFGETAFEIRSEA